MPAYTSTTGYHQQLSGASFVHGSGASGITAVVFPIFRYNGRRNLTVHVSFKGISIRALPRATAVSRILSFLDTGQPTATPTILTSFPSATFVQHLPLLLLDCRIRNSSGSLRSFHHVLTFHLSISVGVAQHGLVVGGLEHNFV